MKLKSNVRLLITCDSGAGAGKTTASKYLSKQFGLNLLTSGLLYRYVAYKLLASKKTATDIIFLKRITKNILVAYDVASAFILYVIFVILCTNNIICTS